MEEYDNTKTIVLNKLEEQKTQNQDSETKETINKVLDKLQKESFNEINYFKLKKLNEGL
jgi:Txe/YoeB family toxin of Txe-Axe toxin-antitoxin module